VRGDYAAVYYEHQTRQRAAREDRLRLSDFRGADYGDDDLVARLPRGWHDIARLLHQRLLELDPDYRLYELRERFGLLHVHARFAAEHNEWCRTFLGRAAGRSARTCQVCGDAARVRDERRLIKTLCERCWNADRALAAERGERFADITLVCLSSIDPQFPDADDLAAWLDTDDV
jgi:hypothetical protein